MTVHHVISDGWSIGVITQELGALYEAFCRGLDSPLPELPLQYGDFAVWQKQWLESCDSGSQLSYWTASLPISPSWRYPRTSRARQSQTSNGHIESIVLPQGSSPTASTNLSNREGVTFFMVALAALKILLQRHSGERRYLRGHFGRRPVPRRARAAHRPVHQSAGLSHRPFRRSHVSGIARTGARDRAGSDSPTRRCPSSGSSR